MVDTGDADLALAGRCVVIFALLSCVQDFPKRDIHDFDGDGVPADVDCDDTDPGIIDVALLWYIDADGDRQGGDKTIVTCHPPSNAVLEGGDCDDTDGANYVDNEEVCDQRDNDCDDDIDEGAPALPDDEEEIDVCGDGVDNDCDGSCDECCFGDGSKEVDNDVADAAFTLLSSKEGSSVGPEVVSGDLFAEQSFGFAAGSPSADTVYAVPAATLGLDDEKPRVVDVDNLVEVDAIAVLRGHTEGDQFGASLATLETELGQDLLVGAPNAQETIVSAIDGAVYLVPGPLSPGTQVSVETADVAFYPDPGMLDTAFGSSILTGFDFDDDGTSDVVVSGDGETLDKGVDTAGAVWVFYEPPPLPTSRSIMIVGSEESDAFGTSLAAGDLDGDGVSDLLVGRTASEIPEVCVFLGIKGARFLPIDSDDSDFAFVSFPEAANLGSSIALGDFDDDARLDVAAGANQPGKNGTSNATVRVFLNEDADDWGSKEAPHDITIDANDMTFVGTDTDRTGTALAARDFDRDGIDDLLVGSPGVGGSGVTYLVRMPQTGGVGPEDVSARWSMMGEIGAGLGTDLGSSTFGSDEWPDVLLAAPGARSVYLWKSAGIR